MSFDPVEMIRGRSREQWKKWAGDLLSGARGWIRGHSEPAVLAGVVFGVILALAFEVVLWIAVLALLAGALIWCVALPEGSAPGE